MWTDSIDAYLCRLCLWSWAFTRTHRDCWHLSVHLADLLFAVYGAELLLALFTEGAQSTLNKMQRDLLCVLVLLPTCTTWRSESFSMEMSPTNESL